jgi:hypothetical protein
MKQFDPDKPYVKSRSMTGVFYEQDGAKFTAGHKFMEMLPNQPAPKPAPNKPTVDARERARAKIAQKAKKGDDPLKDFREPEAPDAIAGALKEDAAARKAEENAA